MPRLTTIGSTEIRVYPDDARRHRRPHFHAVSPDGDAVIGLPELDVMAGAVRNLAAVVTWVSATDNMMALLDAWDAGNPTTKARRP